MTRWASSVKKWKLSVSSKWSRRGADGVLTEDVADPDPQEFLVLERVQDRLRVGGAAAQVGQLRPQLRGGARLIQHQAVEHLVDHAGVVDQDLRQELAPGTQV